MLCITPTLVKVLITPIGSRGIMGYKQSSGNIFICTTQKSNRNIYSMHRNFSCTRNKTRNTLTQASKNGRKPYLFPQKKFVSVFYAINIASSIISNRQTLIVRRENAFCKFHTFFGFVYHVS